MPKKKWTKPKLIVLVKGKQEEVALAGCKMAVGNAFPMPVNGSACYHTNPCVTPCSAVTSS